MKQPQLARKVLSMMMRSSSKEFSATELRNIFSCTAEAMRDALDDLLRVERCVEQRVGQDGAMLWRLAA